MPLRPKFLALAAALCLSTGAQAIGRAPTDWLYFPMYARDTAHAVDLTALKWRPDGLLESASRYPRTGDEGWPADAAARGWYEYETRLIDCETGLSIGTGEKLLARDGTVIAEKDRADEWFTDWKESLPSELSSHRWPNNSELFLACAAANDRALRAERAKLAKRKPAFLSDQPALARYMQDTQRMREKAKFALDTEALQEHPPATLKGVFDLLRQKRQAWLAGFTPTSTAAAGRNAAKPAKWSAQSKAWLEAQDLSLADLRSAGDGTLEATLVTRSTDLLGNAYEHRPSKAADANSALLTMSVDCRTGQTAENRIVWRDYNDRPLATQIVATKDAEHSFSRMIEAIADDPNLFDEGDGDDAVRKICAAAAAQCQGVDPEQLLQSRDGWTEEDLAAVNAAPNPAQALLVARARLHAQRNHLPTCRIGG